LKGNLSSQLPPRREIPALPQMNLVALFSRDNVPLVADHDFAASTRRTRVALNAAQTSVRGKAVPAPPEKPNTFNKPWTAEEV